MLTYAFICAKSAVYKNPKVAFTTEGNNFKLCLTEQLLNVFKPWCEWGNCQLQPHFH